MSGAAKTETLDVDVRGLLVMFWRRRLTITGTLLIGWSVAALALFFIPPEFSGKALLLVHGPGAQTLPGEPEPQKAGGRFDTSFILSEVEVMRSRTMARQVVERLDLMNDSEFNAKMDGAAKPGNFKVLAVYSTELSKLPPEVRDKQVANVVSRFLSRLTIRPVPGSYAVQVEFTSAHPAKAALIANALADAYIERSMDERLAATQKMAEWMSGRMGDLRTDVEMRDRAVQKYKSENNILEGTSTLLSAEQMSEVNGQLASARAQQAEAEARLAQVNELLKSPTDMDSAAAVLGSDLIQKLKLDQARLEGDLSEMSTRYGPRHPEILKIKSEIGEIKNTIRTEITTVGRSIENELLFTQARVDALQDNLAQAGGRKFQDDEVMVGLRALEREAESSRLVLDTFLQNYKRADGRAGLQEPEAKIISYAIVPRAPAYPNGMLIISLSTIMALFTGLALAILMEKLDNTFRSAGQIESALGYPCFALIPTAGRMKAPHLGRFALARPSSPLAESVRSVRMILNLRARGGTEKPGVIAMTSSFPGEGKTTLSLWMGRLAASSGEKVVIVDCDLRRPNLHKSAGRGNEVTIVDYLSGRFDLKKIIEKDNDSGADLVFARSVPAKALDLVSSEKMKALIAELRGIYDLVIIDCPACLAVSDARMLATLADETLYAVAWDRTPREVVASGVKQFADIGYGTLGFVMTHVDVKKHARYGYGDSLHYYGRYAEKYAA